MRFSDVLEDYSCEVGKLSSKMLSLMAMSLGLKMGAFEEKFGETFQGIRMNFYPPCPRPDLVMALSPHSDGSSITILQQGKGNPVGLQILKDDCWVPVQIIPNALVINIGDTLEVMTNGRYKSVEHRAVAHKEMERISLVTFYAPNYGVDVGPLEELVNENNPVKYRTYNHGEYRGHYVSSKLDGRKNWTLLKFEIQNIMAACFVP